MKLVTKAYLKALDLKGLINPFKSQKGSPTMEYIIVIAVGVTFALVLYGVFSDGEFSKTLEGFVNKAMKGEKPTGE